jgi:hypothetical protein
VASPLASEPVLGGTFRFATGIFYQAVLARLSGSTATVRKPACIVYNLVPLKAPMSTLLKCLYPGSAQGDCEFYEGEFVQGDCAAAFLNYDA